VVDGGITSRNDLAELGSTELQLLCWAYEMDHGWKRLISEAIWIVQRDQFARILLSFGVLVAMVGRRTWGLMPNAKDRLLIDSRT
jgi:hypothetical protein